MSKPSISPSILERTLSKVLGQEFNAQDKDWSGQCKVALEQILEAPALLARFAEVLETIDRPAKKDAGTSALPVNMTLRELSASGTVDAISEGLPTGSIPEDLPTVPAPLAAGPEPILPRDLAASLPVWLRRLLNFNGGRVLAVDLRMPAALAAAGDGRELPPVSIGERDSIRVSISSTEMMIDPTRMTSTEPLWLSVGVVREGHLQVLGQWRFEQTVEIYPWVNSFKSGVLVVSTHPLSGD